MGQTPLWHAILAWLQAQVDQPQQRAGKALTAGWVGVTSHTSPMLRAVAEVNSAAGLGGCIIVSSIHRVHVDVHGSWVELKSAETRWTVALQHHAWSVWIFLNDFFTVCAHDTDNQFSAESILL